MPAPADMSADPGSAGAFDERAADYDHFFTDRQLGRWLRQAVHRYLAVYVPGQRVLELGCGTGEDAIWLARRGVQSLATDGSPAMLAVADSKIRGAGLAHAVRLARVDLNGVESGTEHTLKAVLAADQPGSLVPFDGCFSNFGALNCVSNRPALARDLGACVRPGGRLIVVVMGPLCPWETAAFVRRGRFGDACRRLRAGAPARLGDRQVRVWYPSPRRLQREFEPWFRPLGRCGIGVLLPHSQLADLVDRWPRLFERLQRWETAVSHRLPAPWLCDHYLLEFERRGG